MGDDSWRRLCCLQVFERVPVQPRDAREASDVFYKQGQGDVLLNYENEVIFTNRQYPPEERLPYVVPDHNIRVRGPAFRRMHARFMHA